MAMSLRGRLIERREAELAEARWPTRPALKAESDDPAVTALRNALRDPRIPDEAKSLMRQSVAAMVAAWTLTTKE
jgi:hypothetical protein